MLARHRKHEPGEPGPAASRQAGSSVGGNIHMKKAPGTRAPRITPAEQGPHKERSRARVAGHDQQSRGEQMPGAGNAPRTSVSERIKHIMPAHLAKLTAAVCRSSLPRPRCLPSLIIRWTGHVPGFMTWTHAVGRHMDAAFRIPAYDAALFWKPVSVARS